MKQISVSLTEEEIDFFRASAEKNQRSLAAEIRYRVTAPIRARKISDPDQDINITCLINQDQETAREETQQPAAELATGTDGNVLLLRPRADAERKHILRKGHERQARQEQTAQPPRATHQQQPAQPQRAARQQQAAELAPIQTIIPSVIKADEREIEKLITGQVLSPAFISKAAKLYGNAVGLDYQPDVAAVWQANHFAKCAIHYLNLDGQELEKFLFDRMLAMFKIRARQHTTTATWASCFGHSYLKDFYAMASVVSEFRAKRDEEKAKRSARQRAEELAPQESEKKQMSFKEFLAKGQPDEFTKKIIEAKKERDADGSE